MNIVPRKGGGNGLDLSPPETTQRCAVLSSQFGGWEGWGCKAQKSWELKMKC